MAQNIKNIALWQKGGKTLQGFIEFIIGPWLKRANVKPLQEKVDFLERRMYKGLQETEERLELMIQHLQTQLDSIKDNTNTQLNDLKTSDLSNQVEDVLQQSAHISQVIKPTVEVLSRELEDKKQRSEEITNIAEIQAKQNRLQDTLGQLEELTATFPNLEVQRLACLEAGKWLLTHRAEVARLVALELLVPQHPQTEEFRHNIRQYLKLLGHCLENGIEPRLLYQGVITHQQPSVEMYLKAFELIKNKYVTDWESLDRVSTQAAEELRRYLSYLIDYIVNYLTRSQVNP